MAGIRQTWSRAPDGPLGPASGRGGHRRLRWRRRLGAFGLRARLRSIASGPSRAPAATPATTTTATTAALLARPPAALVVSAPPTFVATAMLTTPPALATALSTTATTVANAAVAHRRGTGSHLADRLAVLRRHLRKARVTTIAGVLLGPPILLRKTPLVGVPEQDAHRLPATPADDIVAMLGPALEVDELGAHRAGEGHGRLRTACRAVGGLDAEPGVRPSPERGGVFECLVVDARLMRCRFVVTTSAASTAATSPSIPLGLIQVGLPAAGLTSGPWAHRKSSLLRGDSSSVALRV